MYNEEIELSINTQLELIGTARDMHEAIGEHSMRVSNLAVKLGHELDLNNEEMTTLRIGSYFHDVGKMYVSKDILNSTNKLTKIERKKIQNHPLVGARCFSKNDDFLKISEIISLHHERIDGEGYPYGLHGSLIPKLVKIVSICDSYDAMIDKRSYRQQPLSEEEALCELIRHSGTQFDAVLVEIFVEMIRNKN